MTLAGNGSAFDGSGWVVPRGVRLQQCSRNRGASSLLASYGECGPRLAVIPVPPSSHEPTFSEGWEENEVLSSSGICQAQSGLPEAY